MATDTDSRKRSDTALASFKRNNDARNIYGPMNDVCRKYNGDHTKPPKNITRKAWIFLDLRKVVYKPHV